MRLEVTVTLSPHIDDGTQLRKGTFALRINFRRFLLLPRNWKDKTNLMGQCGLSLCRTLLTELESLVVQQFGSRKRK